MIYAQNTKRVTLLRPQSVTSQTTVSATVNVVGWDYAEIVLQLDTAAATSTESTILVTEGDGTTYATHADLAMTTAAPNTSDGQFYVWFLDLRKRKKNLKITYMPSVAKLASAHAVLSRGEQAPASAAARGLAGQVVA